MRAAAAAQAGQAGQLQQVAGVPAGAPPTDPSADMAPLLDAFKPDVLLMGAGMGIGMAELTNRMMDNGSPASVVARIANKLDNFGPLARLNDWLVSHVSRRPDSMLSRLLMMPRRDVLEHSLIAEQLIDRVGGQSVGFLAQHGDTLVKYGIDPMRTLGSARTINELKTVTEGLQAQLTARLAHASGAEAKELQGLVKALKGAGKRAGSLTNSLEAYQMTRGLMANGGPKGPVGRTFTNMFNILRRTFNGEIAVEQLPGMAKGAAQAGAKKGLVEKLMGAPMVGAITFGQALAEMRHAEEGDKLKTFMYNAIGLGLFNWLGWEVGTQLLNTTGLGNKLINFVGSKLPFLGKNLASKALFGLSFAPTIGGAATFILSAFVFGSLFQKVGEALSTALFGKPQSVIKREQAAAGGGEAASQPTMTAGPVAGADPAAMPAGLLPSQPAARSLEAQIGAELQASQAALGAQPLGVGQLMPPPNAMPHLAGPAILQTPNAITLDPAQIVADPGLTQDQQLAQTLNTQFERAFDEGLLMDSNLGLQQPGSNPFSRLGNTLLGRAPHEISQALSFQA